jgi:hypothetical protein
MSSGIGAVFESPGWPVWDKPFFSWDASFVKMAGHYVMGQLTGFGTS